MTLEERLENVRKQQEGAKELFIKCQGAIDILLEMIKDQATEDE